MGVGDTKWSFAFDGSRCKTWNGPVTSERDNNYGREWNEGGGLLPAILEGDIFINRK